MRRSLAAALLGLSLWIGSLAWTGFVMTRTVLDPQRSEEVADALLEDDAVREQLVDNIAGGVGSALPPGAPVDRATLDRGARTALASPAVEALVRAALVETHQAFLGEGSVPDRLEPGRFGSAARAALVAERPELDAVLPAAPAVEVPLPTDRVPDAGPVRRALLAAVPVLAALSAAGILLALVVTTDRPRVLRRAGFWAIGLAAVVLVVAYVVPAAAARFLPDQAVVVAALVRALAGAARPSAVVLAGVGVAAVAVSLAWRRSPATDPPPAQTRRRGQRRAAPVRRDLPRPASRPPARRPPAPSSPAPSSPAPSPPPAPSSPPPGAGGADEAIRVDRRWTDATRVEAGTARAGARWVEGVGWVHEGPDPIPAGARWVAGVGYVLDD